MTLLKTLHDFMDFAILNQHLKLPLAMTLSFDLLELQINPTNVWTVLQKVNNFHNLRHICDKVF